MRYHKALPMHIMGCILAVLLVASCGKSEDESAKGTTAALEEIAKQAGQEFSVEKEVSDIKQMIEAAGYETTSYVQFPAQELGKKGRLLIYSRKSGKKSGGIIYMKKTGVTVAPAWHWYYEDMVPETVDKIELNDDGLWDIKVISKKGDALEYIQTESFVLTAADRSDWIAMNGNSSTPLTEEHAMWKCFDSDSSTAWKSSVSANDQVYVELAAPFGIEEGILTVQTMESEQPRHCTLYADGKKLQEFELEARAARQMVRLEGAVKGARSVRLVFDSIHGGGDVVSVAELAIK